MRLVTLTALALLLAACTEGGGAAVGVAAAGGAGSGAAGATGSKAVAPVHAPVSQGDPSGTYYLTSKGDTGPGAYVVCQLDQQLTLTYQDGRLQGSLDSSAGLASKEESLDGTYDGSTGQATLTGTINGNLTNGSTGDTSTDVKASAVIYQLTYDPATQHFTGTRNGAKVWAIPFVADTSAACDASPTPAPVPTIAEGTIIPGGDPPL